jgi:hypothetical protein
MTAMMGPVDISDIRFVGLAVIVVAAVLWVLGLVIIRRINRNPDESPDHWRSHHR